MIPADPRANKNGCTGPHSHFNFSKVIVPCQGSGLIKSKGNAHLIITKQNKIMKKTIEIPCIENFDLDYADRELFGAMIKKSFGGQTIQELKRRLSSQTMDILQSVIQKGDITANPHHAAKAALIHIAFHQSLNELHPTRQINSFGNEEIGAAMIRVLWMFSSDELLTWSTEAIKFYNSIPVNVSGMEYETIEDAIDSISRFSSIIKQIAIVEAIAA
jgi:hypothetical protein